MNDYYDVWTLNLKYVLLWFGAQSRGFAVSISFTIRLEWHWLRGKWKGRFILETNQFSIMAIRRQEFILPDSFETTSFQASKISFHTIFIPLNYSVVTWILREYTIYAVSSDQQSTISHYRCFHHFLHVFGSSFSIFENRLAFCCQSVPDGRVKRQN